MPSVEFHAGNMTDIGLSLNNKKIIVFIKQQQLVKNEIDGLVKLDNEQTYNNLSNAFSDFKFKVLRNEHKSYYNQEDLEIYSECRTVANTGIMNIIHDIANTVEIDVSKAYSSAFCKITKILIFIFLINGKNIQVKKLRIFMCMLLNPRNLIHSLIKVIIYVMDNSLNIFQKIK